MQENKNVKKEQNGSSNIIQNAFWFSGGFIMWVALIVFLVIVFGFIFISYINYLYPIGKVLNDDSFDITLIAMRYTVYQVILIFVPLVFFKSICPNDFIAKNKVNIILLIALILYGLFMTTLNKGWVLKINVFLSDFKKTKHYIKVLDKYETRKTHNLLTFDRAYYITFYSWKNNKISNYEIPSFQYKYDFSNNKSNIYMIDTCQGYYGFDFTIGGYYDTYYIEKVDNNKFPDNIKFPLTEEEAKNAMELKKTMDLEQETEN